MCPATGSAPPAIDRPVLDERLAELGRLHAWDPALVTALRAVIEDPDESAAVRINPMRFARVHGAAPHDVIELFLHAAHVGLLTLEWYLLCPACGTAVENFASLRALHRCFFCALCRIHSEANLDDYIQVAFTVAPAVRRMAAHDPGSLSAEDYFATRLTREAHFGSVDGPYMIDFLREAMPALAWLEPGEVRRFEVEVPAGAIVSAEYHAHTGAMVAVGDGPREVRFVIGETQTTASCDAVAAGPVTVTVDNRRAARMVWLLACRPAHTLEAPPGPIVLEPMLTGAALLTNQTFRRLFRRETVQGAEGIGVRDVTLLFTDLKGSTALYERMGDMRAFALVHAHFDELAAVVDRHDGAVVKTIGDAVMAAFPTPRDAVGAAVDMQRRIDRYNSEQGGGQLVLKIGVHRGPSIAVTLNDSLDYFGHTVNVAARVQGLAEADQIVVTDDVYRAAGVAELAPHVASHDAQLRGIQQEVRVHRISRAPA